MPQLRTPSSDGQGHFASATFVVNSGRVAFGTTSDRAGSYVSAKSDVSEGVKILSDREDLEQGLHRL